jgi:hypothetical protein
VLLLDTFKRNFVNPGKLLGIDPEEDISSFITAWKQIDNHIHIGTLSWSNSM